MESKNNASHSITNSILADHDLHIPSAVPLTPLELNEIKLDERHTVLTPQYLEALIKNPPTTEEKDM